jgi:hypothetical protein
MPRLPTIVDGHSIVSQAGPLTGRLTRISGNSHGSEIDEVKGGRKNMPSQLTPLD